MFAKLYGTDKDQVLVKIDAGEDGNPEIRVFFSPEELGVCSCALQWEDDTDASWDKAEAAFEQIDEKGARDMAAQVCKQLGIIRPTKTEAQHD